MYSHLTKTSLMSLRGRQMIGRWPCRLAAQGGAASGTAGLLAAYNVFVRLGPLDHVKNDNAERFAVLCGFISYQDSRIGMNGAAD